ncbi:MAG: hypothetical protein LC772_10375 [Chloroflexi bacterium]|nr:hypothetical protein [Chloroflexota bacterium]
MACAGWTFLFLGAAGVLIDSTFGIPAALMWLSYILALAGAALFAVSTVLRSPPPPAFLNSAPDPWETPDGKPRY